MKRKAPTTLSPQTRPVPRFRPRPLAMAVALALAARPVGAATITADGTNCTLVDAITAANIDTVTGGCTAGQGADIIELTADVTLTAVDNDTDGPNGLPSVQSTITVNGHGHTIARSSAAGTLDFRLLHVATTGNLTLNQVTLRNGRVASCTYYGCFSGGAILNDGTVALVDSTASSNSARYGGGLFNSGTATLTHSTVSGNYASDGGGLHNTAHGTVTLVDSTVSGNASLGDGGGLANFGTVTLINSTVSGNYAFSGGGLLNVGTTMLTHSTISGNSAGYRGGGLSNYLDSGTATLTNSTVSGNSADGGGGLWNNGGTATLINSTVSGNSVNYYGGGGLWNYFGTVTLINTLIANSPRGGDCIAFDAVTPVGINLIEDGSCSASAFPADTDPQLGPLADNGGPTLTHALLAGSPAIDAIALGVGGCGTDITTDQRGVSRPQPVGGNCDIGAFELGQAPPPGIAPILDFFDQAVSNGELRGAGSGKSARHRLHALRNMLVTAGDAIAQDKIKAACGQLAAALKHIDTDGVLKPREFVTGSAALTLAQMIQDLRAQLGCA